MRTLIAVVLLALAAGPSPLFAQSTDFSIPAHVSRVDGRAILQRADETDEDLERNLTLTEGDRIRTLGGRVEVLFADGTLLHLDRNTVVDFQRDDFVRVMEGRVRWSVPRAARQAVRVDAPAATIELDPGGEYRIAVAPNGDAELMVFRGSGALLNDEGDTSLRAGERAVAVVGRAPSQAYYANAALADDFDRWSDGLQRAHAAAASLRYLPNELHPYGSVFDSYGSWRSHPSHGYVWYPVADQGWQPYSHGRWHSYPRYGWTWIGHDPWGWPTHHFGRWGFSAGAWFWIPGRRWSPAWVAWASSPGYVGWSPLGWDNRPLFSLNINIGNRYSAGYPWCGWTFIRDRHFGGRWGRPDVFIGTSVAVVARGGGLQQLPDAPIAGRARPRNGVLPGTAIPRGTAITRPGNGGGASEGGLAGVPTSRPRRIPTETIRTPPEPRRSPEPRTSTEPRMSPEPRTTEPRAPREPRAAEPRTPPAPRPGGGDATPAPAQGRPARPRAGGDEPQAQSAPAPDVREPRQPSYSRQPSASRQPSVSREPSSSRPAEPPAYRAPDRQPRAADRPSPPSSPAPRASERPSSSGNERRSSPAMRAPQSSGGGNSGGSNAGSSGDRRAPSSAAPRSGGQAQSRRRGGG